MGLVLRKNFVLTPPNDSFAVTVVKTYTTAKAVVLCVQDRRNPKKPFIHRLNQPLLGFPLNAFNAELGDFDSDERFENIKPHHIEIMNENRRLISPIVDDKEIEDQFFQGLITKKELKRIAKLQNKNVATLYRVLGRYYAFGQFDKALLPFFNSIPVGRIVPVDYKEAAKLYPKGIGNTGNSTNIFRRRHNQEDIALIDIFIKTDLRRTNYKAWEFLHGLYLAKNAMLLKNIDGRDYEVIPHRYLTYNQFVYLMKLRLSQTDLEWLKNGSKGFRNKLAVITGAATDVAIGPTSRYEIDATTLDIYLISRVTSKKIKVIGRPILYTVVDTSSTVIAGYYLSVNTQTYESVLLALFNAMTDKTEHCARYGVYISDDDWPIYHLCNEVMIDNGPEHTLATIRQLVKERIIKLGTDVAESYFGRSKGTGEGLFNILTKNNIYPLRGSVQKDRAKAMSHPSTKAIFTIDDINEIIIKGILMHNQTAEVPDKLTQEAMISGVEPTPINVFKWGIENLMDGGMRLPATEIMKKLLPRQLATVNKRGVAIKVGKRSLRYIEEDEQFKEWRQEVSYSGGAKVEVIVNPLSTNEIWYAGPVTGKRLIKLRLCSQQARMNNLSIAEALDALKAESVFLSANKIRRDIFKATIAAEAENMTQHNIKLLKDVAKIPGKSMPNNVKENRVIEQELEMMEVSLSISKIMALAMEQSKQELNSGRIYDI